MHGLSVPLAKVGYHLPRTISNAIESREVEEPESFRIPERVYNEARTLRNRHRRRRGGSSQGDPARPIFRVGGSIIQPGTAGTSTPRARTTQGIELETMTRNTSTSGKRDETSAGGIKDNGAVHFGQDAGTGAGGNGMSEQKAEEPEK